MSFRNRRTRPLTPAERDELAKALAIAVVTKAPAVAEELLIEQARNEGYAAVWDFRVRQEVRELARYVEDWPGGA